jgi:hypothetical protein
MDSVDEALFTAATQVTVHNGKKAKFWLSSWVNGGSSALIFPDLFNHTRRQQRSVAEAMHNNTWISDLMHNPSTSLLVNYMLLWILVDAAQFNPQDPIEDEIVWTRSANDNYSAKMAYEMQFDGSLESSFPTQLWNMWAPSRYTVFIWLLLLGRIWTADRLLHWEWKNDYFYSLSIRNLETVLHLFMECPVARQVWLEVSN